MGTDMQHVKSGILTTAIFAAVAIWAAPSQATILVEAESFEDLGGWKLDTQFIDEMGSPYLLAHGLGKPVKDASTTITLQASGQHHVWVRTKDWVATAVRRADALGARNWRRRTRFKSHRGVFHRDVSLARGVRGCAGAQDETDRGVLEHKGHGTLHGRASTNLQLVDSRLYDGGGAKGEENAMITNACDRLVDSFVAS